MMFAKVKGDPSWYRVVDIIDPGYEGQNIYHLDSKGMVAQEDLERLEFD